MKTKRNYFKTAVLTLLFGFMANAQSTNKTKLPEPALDFLKMHFTEHKVARVQTGEGHTVFLSNGVTVRFDSRGNWKGINGNYHELPKQCCQKKWWATWQGNSIRKL